VLSRLPCFAAGEKSDDDDDDSDGRDSATESGVSGTTDERETAQTTDNDGRKPNSDDVVDSSPEKQIPEQDSSDSETPQTSDKVASDGDDIVGGSDLLAKSGDDIIIEKEVPQAQETIRDRLEKAGVRTNGDETLLIGYWSYKHCCVLSNPGLSNATSKRPKLAFFHGKICPPISRNCQNRILHISKINFYFGFCWYSR